MIRYKEFWIKEIQINMYINLSVQADWNGSTDRVKNNKHNNSNANQPELYE